MKPPIKGKCRIFKNYYYWLCVDGSRPRGRDRHTAWSTWEEAMAEAWRIIAEHRILNVRRDR